MKVKELMTTNARTCKLAESLACAAGLMWEADCGVVPVIKEDGKVVGLITDRDICMAAMIKGQNESTIAVEEAMSAELFVCKPEDDIHSALNTMRENKVLRLPVVSADGGLEGILSMNDIVLRAEEAIAGKKPPALSYADVVNAYKSICQHRRPMQRTQATGAN